MDESQWMGYCRAKRTAESNRGSRRRPIQSYRYEVPNTLPPQVQRWLEAVECRIAAVPDPLLRVILRGRYIEGWPWNRIARQCGWKDGRTPRRRVQRFLQEGNPPPQFED